MRRREFITLIGGAVAWPLGANAQLARSPRRIGHVFAGPRETVGHLARAFEQRLRDLNYRVGEDLIVVTRFSIPELNAMEENIRTLIKEVDCWWFGQQ